MASPISSSARKLTARRLELPRGHWEYRPKEAMPAISLLPRDEAAACAGFGEFRADLLDVIRRRDVAAIQQILDPMIRSSFSGQPDGRETFDRVWKLHEAGSRFWSELQAALDLGGECRTNGIFVAPYVAGFWPDGVPSDSVAVVGRGVRLRQQPSTDARVLSVLHHELVRPILGQTFEAGGWPLRRAMDAAGTWPQSCCDRGGQGPDFGTETADGV